MFNPFAATTIGALEHTLGFTQRRHELLAGNIANLSTPDYRSRDLNVDEFQTELARSIRDPIPTNASPSENTQPMVSGWPGVLPGMLGHPILSDEAAAASGISSANRDPQATALHPTEASTRDDRWGGPRSAMESIVYHDGSDVSLEQQVTEISKNKHLHNLAISTMRSQFDLLRAAITERA